MFNEIEKELSKKFNNKKIDLVKIRGGGKSKILFFAFLDDERLPSLCIKTPSFIGDNSLVESEFNNLKSIKNTLPEELKLTIPESQYDFMVSDRFVSVEEVINGKQGNFNLDRDYLKIVFDWICSFHKSNIVSKKIIDRNFLADMLSKYKNIREEIKELILDIWGERSIEMPIIKQHGDFHFANIYFKDGLLKIIDWGNYGKVVLPAYDLVFFLHRQKNGIEKNEEFITEYFDIFSIPKEVLYPWTKILEIIGGLEKHG